MLNIDISEVVYKNKQIDVSIEIVLVRCLTNQRAEKKLFLRKPFALQLTRELTCKTFVISYADQF